MEVPSLVERWQNDLLLHRRRDSIPTAPRKDDRTGAKRLQRRWNRLQRLDALHGQPLRVELATTHRILLGGDLFLLHYLYLLPNPRDSRTLFCRTR